MRLLLETLIIAVGIISFVFLCSFFLVLADTPTCDIFDVKRIGYTVHDPNERHSQMSIWMSKHINNCSQKDLVNLYNSMADWAGVADTPELRHKIMNAYQVNEARQKK